MPPRLPLTRLCHSCQSFLSSPSIVLPRQPSPWLAIIPHLQILQQSRSASILSSLSDNPGAYSKKIRRGRGPSSGKGKTSGRGHKGQKQHGKVPANFNGGQTPLEVTQGKRGFKNIFSLDMAVVNLDRIQAWIDAGRLNTGKVITVRELSQSRCVHRLKDGVKILARGKERFNSAINVVVSQASAEAIAAIEAAGGTVQTRFYNKFALRKIKAGLMDPIRSRLSQPLPAEEAGAGPLLKYPLRLPDPAGRKELEYYRDPAHRGYLSYMLEEGQGPSLFWRTPGSRTVKDDGVKQERKKTATQNRIW